VALSALQAQNKVSMNNVDFVKGESAVMTVDLQNTTAFSAFQMDLTLPDGFAIAEGIAIDEARQSGSHSVTYNAQGNKVRIAAYSGNNANLKGTEGTLLTIGLVAEESVLPGIYSATLDNVLFTTADENEMSLAGASAEVSLRYAVESSVTDASLGSISVEGDAYHGSTMKVTVSPVAHYELDQLLVNGEDVTAQVENNVYTIASLASDVNAVASFKPATYVATFMIDGQVIEEKPFAYGATIEAPVAPAKEGHTFAGWSNLPATMPGENITVNGSYNVNSYTVTFKIGEVVISSETLAYGAAIVAPEAPVKEGHTFAGWGEVAATMPAENVTYTGSYDVNSYMVTFKIDDEVIYSESLPYGTAIVAPEAPAKEGHTFNGWGAVAATVPAKDLTYTSSYTVNSYTVTFKIGEVVISSETLAYGAAIVAPEAPVKEGHTFAGWGDVAATVPAENVTYTGSYDVNSYLVTFKIDDEVIYSESLPYGTAIVAPEAPAKEGHTFNGWGAVAATVPAKDLTYTSSYTVNVYTLKFVADGKTVKTEQMAYGAAIVAPEAPAKEGHTFNGWKDVPATMPAGDLTVDGIYTVNSYVVTFKIGDEVLFSESLPYGSKITAPEAPAVEGKVFSGWGKVAETVPAQNVTYEGRYINNPYEIVYFVDGEEYHRELIEFSATITLIEAPVKEGHTFSGWSDVPATMPAGEVKVYGTFTVNNYTVTFKIGDEVVYSEPLAYGSEIVAPEAPVKEGYTFNGWGEVDATVPASDVTYEGSYTVNSYTVTFKIGDEIIYSAVLAYGSEIVAPEAPSKEGHTFAGWGDVLATMPASDVTYEGAYTANLYVVTFKIGDEVISSDSLAYGSEIIAPEAPAKEGYTFDGWGEVAAIVPAMNLTYGGSYSVNYYTVTFKIGDEVIYSESLAYGSEIVAPEAPAKEGYTFSGWGQVASTVPAMDVTYEGSYVVGGYTVTFKIGDEVISTQVLPYGSEIVAPEAPAKEGYTFAGWGEVAATVPAMDVTYTGTYTVNVYAVIFKIGDEVIYADSLAYGSEIVAPEAPAKEGHTFAGWGEVAATVPAMDVTYTGTYTANVYAVIFKIGDEVIYADSLAYGSEIVAPEAPAKEGHTFAGWGEVAATVPAMDVTYTGTYTANVYAVIFKIGDEVIYADSIAYGSEIVAPEAPAKEGHTFAGWGEVAATVPAMDVTYTGTYTVNVYAVIFKIGDEVIYADSLAYGSEIVAPEAPAKEGHTFDGWGEVAETVPASDVVYEGTYTVNIYKVYYYVGEELVYTAEVPYGESMPEYVYEPTQEGDVFEGWIGDVYETMPAHDVVYTANITNGIKNVLAGGMVDIYTLHGVKVHSKVRFDEVKDSLQKGIYIVNGQKVVVK